VKKICVKQIKRKHLYIHFVVYLTYYIFYYLFSILYLSISFLWNDLVIVFCSFLLYYIYLLFLNFDFKSESNIIRANFSGFRISLKPRNIMSNEIHNVHIITFVFVFCANYETTSIKNPGSQEVYSNHDNWHPRIQVLSQYFAAILF
jgi:signal transduction histidine kinase